MPAAESSPDVEMIQQKVRGEMCGSKLRNARGLAKGNAHLKLVLLSNTETLNLPRPNLVFVLQTCAFSVYF